MFVWSSNTLALLPTGRTATKSKVVPPIWSLKRKPSKSRRTLGPFAHRDQALEAEQQFLASDADQRRVADRAGRGQIDKSLHQVEMVDIRGRCHAALTQPLQFAKLDEGTDMVGDVQVGIELQTVQQVAVG